MNQGIETAEILIVSGLSGSGKSVAIRALEDIGYFCIDNLPVELLEKLIELLATEEPHFNRIALVMDSRDPKLIDRGKETLDRLALKGLTIRILFLESSDEVLVRRFKETRRTHPLAKGGTIREGILAEREMLDWMKQSADVKIDTSDTNAHQLREMIQDAFAGSSPLPRFNLTFLSFGFKYGLPSDADMVMDVRFLPNPHWVEELKPKTGQDPEVAKYVLDFGETEQFLSHFKELLQFLLPFYRKEGKHYLTVAFGCTGGRHRSVAIAEELARQLAEPSLAISLHHRDIAKSE